MEKAYAKINLFLNVKNKREDNYHELEMINVEIDLFDEMTFTLIEEDKIEIIIHKANIKLEDNLIYKVARYLKEKCLIKQGIRIDVIKNIPLGSGLAGGSSDAAKTIEMLNILWMLGLTKEEMSFIGKKFGADIPFFFQHEPCYIKGIGDIIAPVSLNLKDYNIYLFNPEINVSTKLIFESIKKEEYDLKPIEKCLNVLNDDKLFVAEMFNTLENVTKREYTEVNNLINDLHKKYPKEKIMMSGSGGSVFIITKNELNIRKNTKHFLRKCRIV